MGSFLWVMKHFTENRKKNTQNKHFTCLNCCFQQPPSIAVDLCLGIYPFLLLTLNYYHCALQPWNENGSIKSLFYNSRERVWPYTSGECISKSRLRATVNKVCRNCCTMFFERSGQSKIHFFNTKVLNILSRVTCQSAFSGLTLKQKESD